MHKYLLIFLFLLPLCRDSVTAQSLTPIRDVFVAMPDSIHPLVTKNNRLDLIDFIDNNMEAKVRNRMDTYVTLEQLTPEYLRFRTSNRGLMEMRSFTWQPNDTTFQQVVAVVQTVQGGFGENAVRHSNIRFITPDWQPIPDVTVAMPQLSGYFSGTLTDSTLIEPALHARLSLTDFTSVEMRLSADEETLTCLLQTGDLNREERKAANQIVQPIVLHWNGTGFNGK